MYNAGSQHSFSQHPSVIIYLIIYFHTQNFVIEIHSAARLFVLDNYFSIVCSRKYFSPNLCFHRFSNEDTGNEVGSYTWKAQYNCTARTISSARIIKNRHITIYLASFYFQTLDSVHLLFAVPQ